MARRYRWMLAAAAVALAAALPVLAEDQASGPSAKEQVKSGFKETGHAIGRGATALGHVFRDGAKETWRATQPGREKVKDAGREVGHGAKNAGQAVGEGAKKAGRSVKAAVAGDGKGEARDRGEAQDD